MMICFCHMIRTAGTTLHHIFRNNYGINHVEVHMRDFTGKDLVRLLHFNRRIKSVGGHYMRTTLGLSAAYPGLVYITFLRDPVDRFISHYNHGRNRGHHSMSIQERVKLMGEADYQVKFLRGCQDFEERNFSATREDLEKAKRTLAEDYSFVGLSEKFEESLVLMKKSLRLEDLDIRYERMHATKKIHIAKQQISPDLMDEIKEANRMDQELYLFARDELFERQMNDYPGDLAQEVANFKQMNAGYKFMKSSLVKYRIAKYLVYKPFFKLASRFS